MAHRSVVIDQMVTEDTIEKPPSIAMWIALALAWLMVYWPSLQGLVTDWWSNPDYSHGLLVPFAIVAVIYQRRGVLRAATVQPETALGLLVIGLSQAMFLAGYLGAEFFLQRTAMVGFTVGAILFLAGWPRLKPLLLPLLLFQLSIPIPVIVFNRVALPLQLLASSWAETILRLCGIAVYRSGNILQLSRQTMNVTEACSGIRSLVSLITLAIIMIAFDRVHWLIRTFYVGSAVVVAVVANVIRVSGTGLLGCLFGMRAATGFFHLFEGWFIFVLSFVLLGLELKILKRLFTRKPEGAGA
jgi:exosortase